MIDFFRTIINTCQVWLSIIAINMTVIGLTSLAEKKSIIGVDYTQFLFTKYRLWGRIRILILFLIFAIINSISLYIMTLGERHFVFKGVVLVLLVLCLVFIIYYFFAFILIENKSLKRQVLQHEILGLYFDPESVEESKNPWLDLIQNGPIAEKNPTKHLGTNVIAYFDVYNFDTCEAFNECFGPESLLYPKNEKEDNELVAYYQKLYHRNPPRYLRKHFCEDGERRTLYFSREFFDFLQFSRSPILWLFEITKLMFDYNHFEGSWKRFDKQLFFSNMSMVMFFLANDGYAFDRKLLSKDFADRFSRYVGESWDIDEIVLYKNDKDFDRNDICTERGLKEYQYAFYLASFVYKMLSLKYLNEDTAFFYRGLISGIYISDFPGFAFSEGGHTAVVPRLLGCLDALDESFMSNRAEELVFDILRCYSNAEKGNVRELMKKCWNPFSKKLISKYLSASK